MGFAITWIACVGEEAQQVLAAARERWVAPRARRDPSFPGSRGDLRDRRSVDRRRLVDTAEERLRVIRNRHGEDLPSDAVAKRISVHAYALERLSDDTGLPVRTVAIAITRCITVIVQLKQQTHIVKSARRNLEVPPALGPPDRMKLHKAGESNAIVDLGGGDIADEGKYATPVGRAIGQEEVARRVGAAEASRMLVEEPYPRQHAEQRLCRPWTEIRGVGGSRRPCAVRAQQWRRGRALRGRRARKTDRRTSRYPRWGGPHRWVVSRF